MKSIIEAALSHPYCLRLTGGLSATILKYFFKASLEYRRFLPFLVYGIPFSLYKAAGEVRRNAAASACDKSSSSVLSATSLIVCVMSLRISL